MGQASAFFSGMPGVLSGSFSQDEYPDTQVSFQAVEPVHDGLYYFLCNPSDHLLSLNHSG
ncbi:hypothetical protein D3C81_2182380 [compost metagenome]